MLIVMCKYEYFAYENKRGVRVQGRLDLTISPFSNQFPNLFHVPSQAVKLAFVDLGEEQAVFDRLICRVLSDYLRGKADRSGFRI